MSWTMLQIMTSKEFTEPEKCSILYDSLQRSNEIEFFDSALVDTSIILTASVIIGLIKTSIIGAINDTNKTRT